MLTHRHLNWLAFTTMNAFESTWLLGGEGGALCGGYSCLAVVHRQRACESRLCRVPRSALDVVVRVEVPGRDNKKVGVAVLERVFFRDFEGRVCGGLGVSPSRFGAALADCTFSTCTHDISRRGCVHGWEARPAIVHFW